MKRTILSLVLVIIGCISVFANHDINVVEGTLAPLKDGGTATVVINMNETTFDSKMPLREDERFADVDKYIPEFQSEFVREFNEHTKKFQMVKDEAEGNYKFIIDVTNLDVYVTLFSFKGGVATKIWGTLTIKDTSDNKVAVIQLKEFESSGFTYNISLEETFEVLAKNLAKRINKGK
jgi:hypothetical protein